MKHCSRKGKGVRRTKERVWLAQGDTLLQWESVPKASLCIGFWSQTDLGSSSGFALLTSYLVSLSFLSLSKLPPHRAVVRIK